ncbi:MAG TPA: gephyrin-like molybdotransferase Glp [Candidatus Binataceae bacterium]|nr:gephyrin-like molybdotransferase Glp [Candidatus Binataceae bacterium]
MIGVDEALATVLGAVEPLGVERVPLLDALGRVLAQEVRSPRDIPGFDNSAMDGFAVRSADVAGATADNPVRLTVTETVPAGKMPSHEVHPGQAARTMTGAPIASGADAIVPVEQTRESGNQVEILTSAPPHAFVRPRGEDVKQGELAMTPGRLLGAADLGMLASLNRAMVGVYRRPRVAIVATGDELVDVDEAPSGAQVVNSSAYALSGGIREAGGEAAMLRVARDTPDEVRERLTEAMAFDIIFTTGGVSVGQFDHVKTVMDELGLKTLFHGVAQRPGRPLKFGTLENRPVFGLPGNPVSTLVCFYLYARPALLKMSGRTEVGLPRVTARCARDIKLPKGLTEFVRVKLERRDSGYVAVPTGNQGSGIFSSIARADGLLIGPAERERLREGDSAQVLMLAVETGEPFFERRFHKN